MKQEKDERYPRILIISNNCFSTEKNNGKTLASLFANYPKDKLAQFYIWPELPDSKACNCYYRLTDKDMITSFFTRKSPCGKVIFHHENKNNMGASPIFGKGFTQWHCVRLARELIWLGNRWKSGGLYHWIKIFSPDVLFFCGINNPSLFRIADIICKDFSLPVICFIGDDYYLPRFSLSCSYHIRRIWMIYWMKKLLHTNKSELITINEYMRESYTKFFGKDSRIAINCVPIPDEYPNNNRVSNTVHKIAYIGNLSHNRWKTLSFLADILSNSEFKNRFVLEIYTREKPNKKILDSISRPPYSIYCGSLDENGVKRVQFESDIVLHVEAFDYTSRKNTMLSLSTKIPEYMAAGKPILAIGPPEIASIRFLKDNTHSVCVTKLDKKLILEALSTLSRYDTRKHIGLNAWEKIRQIIEKNSMHNLIERIANDLVNC